MGKPKCPTCMGCMDFVYLDNHRYLHCWFCRTYYSGKLGELVLIDNPFIKKEENKDVDK